MMMMMTTTTTTTTMITIIIIMGTVREDVGTFIKISRSILLRMRNISESLVEKIKTHSRSKNFFP